MSNTYQNTTTVPLIVFLFFSLAFLSPLSAQSVRGLHVNNFKYILGDESLENELLSFAQTQGFNYLLLYNLNYINQHYYNLSDAADAAVLANFISKAKTQYGILQVGGIGEKYTSFIPQFTYNQRYADIPEAQIDVYSIEFEFWNSKLYKEGPNGHYCNDYLIDAGLPCTQAGAFTYYHEQLENLRGIADEHGVILETYIGSPTNEQARQLAELVDRVMVHYFRRSDTYSDGRSIYNYKLGRIEALASAEKAIDVLPLFNAKPHFMGPWLENNDLEQAFSTFLFGQNGFNQQAGDWKQYININGFQWYRYSDCFSALSSTAPLLTTSTNKPEASKNRIQSNAYPNPALDRINLSWQAGLKVTNVFINGVDGQMVYHYQTKAGESLVNINTASLPKGLLLISLQTDQGLQQHKIIHQ